MDEKFMEQAAALELLERVSAINAASRQREGNHPGFDGLHCIEPDCGDEIPEGRLALKKQRCLACQARKEQRRG